MKKPSLLADLDSVSRILSCGKRIPGCSLPPVTLYSKILSMNTLTPKTFAPLLSVGEASRKRRKISVGGLFIVTPLRGLCERVRS